MRTKMQSIENVGNTIDSFYISDEHADDSGFAFILQENCNV